MIEEQRSPSDARSRTRPAHPPRQALLLVVGVTVLLVLLTVMSTFGGG